METLRSWFNKAVSWLGIAYPDADIDNEVIDAEDDVIDVEDIDKVKRRRKNLWVVAGLMTLAIIFVIAGSIWLPSHKKGTVAVATSAISSHSPAIAKVVDANGSTSVLPVVGTKGEVAPVNTTHDVRTPASFKPFEPGNKPVLTWTSLVDAVNAAHADWYRNAINDRAKVTKFDWADITKWAKDPQLKGVYTLTIQVFGGGFSDTQARAIAAELVGRSLADRLPIVRHSAGLLINTRSVGYHKVGDFLDVRRMVRVSLSPVVYANGKVTGVRGNSGIFADCLNIWRLAREVKHPKSPGKKPKHHLTPKNWKLDPFAQGNAPVGGGQNQNPGPGTYTKKPKKPGNTPRPNPTTPPPSPVPNPGATSTPTPDPKPTPTPDVPTPVATGTVLPPGM